MDAPNRSDRAPQATQAGLAVAEALSAMSAALTMAGIVVGALACVVWIRSGQHGQPDFPGRYLVAVLPLLCAAGTLKMYAAGMARGLS